MVAFMDDVPAPVSAEQASITSKKSRRVFSLLIDNYDSYSYNIMQMLAQVNGTPNSVTVIKNDDFGSQFNVAWDHFVAQATAIASQEDVELKLNVVISPGPGHPSEPKDFGMCSDAIRHATVPVLGVCLGHQGLAQVYGGQVVEAEEVMHGRTSRVFIEGESPLFAHIPNGFDVVRYHSLVIDPKKIPEELEVFAKTQDGVIMAVRHRTKQQFGVQFHPEAVCSEFGYQLFQNFKDVTLAHCASKCVLHHSNHPEQTAKLHDKSVQKSTDAPDYRVLIQRVSTGLASLEFAEFVFMFSDAVELPFAFRGGFVGYFGYEVLGSDQEGKKMFNNKIEVQGERAPDASFLFADRTLVFDHQDGVIYSLSLSECKIESESISQMWHGSIKSQLKELSEAYTKRSGASTSLFSSVSGKDEVIFRPSRSRAQYVADIDEIQRLIRAGETYEVCLTNHLRAEYALRDPLAFYRMLRCRNPAPFAGFYLSNPRNRFQTPDAINDTDTHDTYALCCSSPERFLRVGADGWMESKPIKGTRPRGRDSNEDSAIAEELANCEKDRAENMMIADLVRNDFGVVARVGSVHVPRLMGVETYATVHQLVTTVRAQRREDADVVDVLRATFPGGSMTGAPKKRTMHIIRELERGPRGVYSGGLGFLSIDGSCDLNIIIRTAIVTPNSVTLGAGGAIVALSDSDDEYDEMLLKARALVATIGAYATGKDNGGGARVVVD
ncbi:hypothetical protein AM588_10000571 [Phytophthora nicotianae]|uniref:aminodeoxychorismate synthase n=1 Tax=Phytophthora nicotianae TaxID=4792 RepID=A0A0W8CI43_PHYNI|nr:hypothetical protein AM588_10000571 [Phytophthora nicotianae]